MGPFLFLISTSKIFSQNSDFWAIKKQHLSKKSGLLGFAKKGSVQKSGLSPKVTTHRSPDFRQATVYLSCVFFGVKIQNWWGEFWVKDKMRRLQRFVLNFLDLIQNTNFWNGMNRKKFVYLFAQEHSPSAQLQSVEQPTHGSQTILSVSDIQGPLSRFRGIWNGDSARWNKRSYS